MVQIDDEYRVNWIVDNLPVATKYYVGAADENGQVTGELEERYEKGFPLGFTGTGTKVS